MTVLVWMDLSFTQGLNSSGYAFPFWTAILGNLISFSTIMGILLWAIYFMIDVLLIKKQVSFLSNCFKIN